MMEQNSCRVTAEIELNIASMQFKNIPVQYQNLNNRYALVNGLYIGTGFELPFTINVGGNGMTHKGKWIYEKTDFSNGQQSGRLYCFLENVKYLNVTSKGVPGSGSYGSTPDVSWTKGETKLHNAMYSHYNFGQIVSLSKKITIHFDPTNDYNKEEILNEKVEEYLKILGPFKPTNKVVTIICGSQKFSFDQSWLAKISTVFSEMFESCVVGNPEFKVDGDKPESFKTLKNLLEQKRIKVGDITSDLALFANKYVHIIYYY